MLPFQKVFPSYTGLVTSHQTRWTQAFLLPDMYAYDASGPMFYATDYLGSVRVVVGGNNGTVYEKSNYSAYGARSIKPYVTPHASMPRPSIDGWFPIPRVKSIMG